MLGMIGLSTTFGLFNLVTHSSHHDGLTGLPYQKIRNKPYPWSCPDCNLMDLPCWDACKGRNVTAHH